MLLSLVKQKNENPKYDTFRARSEYFSTSRVFTHFLSSVFIECAWPWGRAAEDEQISDAFSPEPGRAHTHLRRRREGHCRAADTEPDLKGQSPGKPPARRGSAGA